MSTRTRGFWVTNHLANPILRRLLRGPLGRRLGTRLAVLRYRGRRTGQLHELVVQYARDGDLVWIVPGQADRKRWWRNLIEPQPVEVWLAGHHRSAIAAVLADSAADARARGMEAYRSVFPRVEDATVMVRVDIGAVSTNDHPTGGST